MSPDDETEAVALEHVRWSVAVGLTPLQIVREFGGRDWRPMSAAMPGFDEAVSVVARAHRRLLRHQQLGRAA